MLSKSDQWRRRLPDWIYGSVVRWWIVNLVFWVTGLGLLYALIDRIRMPLIIGTLLAAEATTVARFVVNDCWVFGRNHPTWRRLWQFHVACAGGAAIWWSMANVLPRWGIHYLLASALGSACSALFSVMTNFKWIWRGDNQRSSAEEPAVGTPNAKAARAD